MLQWSLRSWAKDTSIHSVCVCVPVCTCGKKKVSSIFSLFFVVLRRPCRCSAKVCVQVCVGNKMYVFSLSERAYYDEQLPQNDWLSPAAVINHAHCPLQPPSNTYKHTLQLRREEGAYKQNFGVTTHPQTSTAFCLSCSAQAQGGHAQSWAIDKRSWGPWNCWVSITPSYVCLWVLFLVVLLTNVFALHVVVKGDAVRDSARTLGTPDWGHVKQRREQTSLVPLNTRSRRLDVHVVTLKMTRNHCQGTHMAHIFRHVLNSHTF